MKTSKSLAASLVSCCLALSMPIASRAGNGDSAFPGANANDQWQDIKQKSEQLRDSSQSAKGSDPEPIKGLSYKVAQTLFDGSNKPSWDRLRGSSWKLVSTVTPEDDAEGRPFGNYCDAPEAAQCAVTSSGNSTHIQMNKVGLGYGAIKYSSMETGEHAVVVDKLPHFGWEVESGPHTVQDIPENLVFAYYYDNSYPLRVDRDGLFTHACRLGNSDDKVLICRVKRGFLNGNLGPHNPADHLDEGHIKGYQVFARVP